MNKCSLYENSSVMEKAIMSLTSALYDAESYQGVSKDELRDALSMGQLLSKKWLLDVSSSIIAQNQINSIVVVGGWMGLLAKCLQLTHLVQVTSVDLSPHATKVASLVLGSHGRAVNADMLAWDYQAFDCVVNTSVEHLPDVGAWSNTLPKGKMVIAQSNNNDAIYDHVSCHETASELMNDLNLSSVLFCGQLEFAMYTRHMVIGIK